jgi:hypothetical protein
MNREGDMWPELPYAPWRDTAATLHLWMQIVGKVRLSLTPWVNHSWQVPLYVSARGLTTSPMPIGAEILELEFDFISHRLAARTSRGEERSLALEPQAVADFYARLAELLAELGVAVETSDMPCELPNPIRFTEDRVHCSYDAEAAHRFWRALLRIDALLKLFRSAPTTIRGSGNSSCRTSRYGRLRSLRRCCSISSPALISPPPPAVTGTARLSSARSAHPGVPDRWREESAGAR